MTSETGRAWLRKEPLPFTWTSKLLRVISVFEQIHKRGGGLITLFTSNHKDRILSTESLKLLPTYLRYFARTFQTVFHMK